ncbi:hypothetical protein [Leifsonia sp. NPDC077715]|uniref:hypothetical protein n=1 Tax=Leifsonia sp. NPDC077715 TaxID=3155539 RepID=UPI0034187AFA
MRSRSRPEWLGGGAEEEVLPAVSTSSLAFQAVLDDLVRAVDAPELVGSVPSGESVPAAAPAPTLASGESWLESEPSGEQTSPFDQVLPEPPRPVGPPPARLRGRGDLTLVVGLGAEVHEAARVLAASADANAEVQSVADRRDALAARADGVRREIPIVAAFSLPSPASVSDLAAHLAATAPDQVWVVVDVSRKHDDSALWVGAVDAVLAVDAVVATGASLTVSPDSVHALGLPVLWLEAPPAG